MKMQNRKHGGREAANGVLSREAGAMIKGIITERDVQKARARGPFKSSEHPRIYPKPRPQPAPEPAVEAEAAAAVRTMNALYPATRRV